MNKKINFRRAPLFRNSKWDFKNLQTAIININLQWINIRKSILHQILTIYSYLLLLIEKIKVIATAMLMLILDFIIVNNQDNKILFNIILTIILLAIVKLLMISRMTSTLEAIAQVFLSFPWAATQEGKLEKFQEENIHD